MDWKKILKPSIASIAVLIVFILIIVYMANTLSLTPNCPLLKCSDGNYYSVPWDFEQCVQCGFPTLMDNIFTGIYYVVAWILFLPSRLFIFSLEYFDLLHPVTYYGFIILNFFYLYVLSIVIVKVYKKIKD